MNSYSVKQVADMLKTNPETVRRWIRAGKLVAHQDSRKGGNIIYESALQEFVKSTPKYAGTTAALLIGTAVISTALIGNIVANKITTEKQIKAAQISSDDIKRFILVEIESKQKAIDTKKKTIQQLKSEVYSEERKIAELQDLLKPFSAPLNGDLKND